jgi:predicted small secreted protein
MKRKMLVLISLLLVAGVLAACGSQREVGEPVLSVTGDIKKTNSGDKYVYDEVMFEEQSVDMTIDDVWLGDGMEYSGILLSDIIETVKPGSDVSTIHVVATDGKTVKVDLEDAKAMDILMVHYLDGEILGDDVGGPVKIAFGDEAQEEYPEDSWAWWVVELKFK